MSCTRYAARPGSILREFLHVIYIWHACTVAGHACHFSRVLRGVRFDLIRYWFGLLGWAACFRARPHISHQGGYTSAALRSSATILLAQRNRGSCGMFACQQIARVCYMCCTIIYHDSHGTANLFFSKYFHASVWQFMIFTFIYITTSYDVVMRNPIDRIEG